MRLANGRFVPKADAARLRALAAEVGMDDETLQRLVKEKGVEGAQDALTAPAVIRDAEVDYSIATPAEMAAEAAKATIYDTMKEAARLIDGQQPDTLVMSPDMHAAMLPVPPSGDTQFHPSGEALLRRTVIGQPFKRVLRARYMDGPGLGSVTYLHGTKGYRTRRLTQKLLAELTR